MRLNSAQVRQTLSQMNAQVLPDDHPAVTQLTDVFGDHTFFLDESGLKALEPAEVPETGMESGEVVSLADWTDPSLTSLTPHELNVRDDAYAPLQEHGCANISEKRKRNLCRVRAGLRHAIESPHEIIPAFESADSVFVERAPL